MQGDRLAINLNANRGWNYGLLDVYCGVYKVMGILGYYSGHVEMSKHGVISIKGLFMRSDIA